MHEEAAIHEEAFRGPLVWDTTTVKNQEWLIELDLETKDELRDVARTLARNPLPTYLLSPDDYVMPRARDIMEKVKHNLDHGPGFANIDAIPVDENDKPIAVQIYWLLASMIARPVAQRFPGDALYDVKDYGRPPVPGSGIRPAHTNYEQSLHNDNPYNEALPDYVGLLCLNPAKSGGTSRIISFYSVHNELLKRDPELLAQLYQPFWFDRMREHADDEYHLLKAPIFRMHNGRLETRLSIFQIESGHALRGKEIDPISKKALDALESVLYDPTLHFEFSMRQGQFQFVNNKELGHTRTEYQDYEEEERKRHMCRLWLRETGMRSYAG